MISEVADPISSSRSITEKDLNSISDIADVHASVNDYSNAVTPAHTTYLFEQEMRVASAKEILTNCVNFSSETQLVVPAKWHQLICVS